MLWCAICIDENTQVCKCTATIVFLGDIVDFA